MSSTAVFVEACALDHHCAVNTSELENQSTAAPLAVLFFTCRVCSRPAAFGAGACSRFGTATLPYPWLGIQPAVWSILLPCAEVGLELLCVL